MILLELSLGSILALFIFFLVLSAYEHIKMKRDEKDLDHCYKNIARMFETLAEVTKPAERKGD